MFGNMQVTVFLQLLWIIGAIFWNLTGLDLVDSGESIPVFIPFLQSIMILLFIGVLLIIFQYFKMRRLFRLVSLSSAIYAGIFVYQIFSTNPDLWVNTSWQWGGAGINLFGLIIGLTGVFGRTHSRTYRPDPISPAFNESGQSEKKDFRQ